MNLNMEMNNLHIVMSLMIGFLTAYYLTSKHSTAVDKTDTEKDNH